MVSPKSMRASIAAALMASGSVLAADANEHCEVDEAKEAYSRAHANIVREVNRTINETDPLEDMNFGDMVSNCIGTYGVSISLSSIASSVVNGINRAAQTKCDQIKGLLEDKASGLNASFDIPFDDNQVNAGIDSGQGWGVNVGEDVYEEIERAERIIREQQERIEQIRSGYQDYDNRDTRR